MQTFLNEIKAKAQSLQKKIIFPETEDLRTLEAIKIIQQEELCQPILVGNPDQILKDSEKLKLDFSKIEIINPQNPDLLKKYTELYFEMRKDKGMSIEEAQKTLQLKNYFANFLLHEGLGDGLISGAMTSTADTVRPALQIIKAKEAGQKVSSAFFMILPDNEILLFADCAIQIDPSAEDLAQIALDTTKTAEQFGIEPRIAMLSFSTNGSAQHPFVDKVKAATKIAQTKAPHLKLEGEMQADAALVESIRTKKFPNSKLTESPTILIFPDLQSGNIGYKLVERLAKAEAIGPLLQGLNKPVNDLSRGCKAQDIANLAALTACQA